MKLLPDVVHGEIEGQDLDPVDVWTGDAAELLLGLLVLQSSVVAHDNISFDAGGVVHEKLRKLERIPLELRSTYVCNASATWDKVEPNALAFNHELPRRIKASSISRDCGVAEQASIVSCVAGGGVLCSRRGCKGGRDKTEGPQDHAGL